MEILEGKILAQGIRKALHKNRSGKFAVAFWGKGAGNYLGFENGFDLKIVCNLSVGGTNPSEIRSLQKLGAEIRHLDSLHAKLGVVGDFSFVGSSNMSLKGLGDVASCDVWDEANLAFYVAEPIIQQRFEELWNRSKPLDEAALKMADFAWSAHNSAKFKAMRPGKFRLLDVLRKDPDGISALNVFVAISLPALDDAKEYTIASKKVLNKYGEKFEIYSDWSDLPKDGIIIAYEYNQHGDLIFCKIYRRNPDFADLEDMPNYDYQVVYPINNVNGHIFKRKDANYLISSIEKYIKKNKIQKNKATYFPLKEILQYVND